MYSYNTEVKLGSGGTCQNLTTHEAEAGIFGLQNESRTARATQKDPGSKNQLIADMYNQIPIAQHKLIYM